MGAIWYGICFVAFIGFGIALVVSESKTSKQKILYGMGMGFLLGGLWSLDSIFNLL